MCAGCNSEAPVRLMTGTFAVPDGYPPGPAIVVIPQWWGIDGRIERVAQRLAALGFAAVAPDLSRGRAAAEPEEAREVMNELDRGRALEDLTITVSFLKNQGATGFGVMGLCTEGSLAWELAAGDDRLEAAVSCSAHMEPDGVDPRCPVQMHVGAQDSVEPATLETIGRRLRARADGSELFVYEGVPHAFMNDVRSERYRTGDPDPAFDRAVAFFTEKLGTPIPV